eukprot:6491324-Amphidinium_carterae.1
MGQAGCTKWSRRMAHMVGRLHRLCAMPDRQGLEAATLWRKILKDIPEYERRFGAPVLLEPAAHHRSLEDITDNVLRSTHQHYADCLSALQREAAASEHQQWKTRLAEHDGCNKLVSSRLKGQRLGQSSSLPVHGRRTFVPTEIFREVTAYWQPIMEATDHGCPERLRTLVDRHVPTGNWAIPKLSSADLASAAQAARIGSSPGYDNWCVADLRLLPELAWQELAEILNVVEHTQMWPQELLHSWTALIPKQDEPGSPNDLRPIRVLPSI